METVDHIPCSVPLCKRRMTRAAWLKRYGTEPTDAAQFICQPHWSAVPQTMRRIYARARRRERRFGVELPAGFRLWRRLKAEAIRIAEAGSTGDEATK